MYESRERCDIVLNVPCKYYVCRCEWLKDLERTCKVIFDLIHMYVFWFIKVYLYKKFRMFTYHELGWLVLVWSSHDFS
jgi:hypothetical protein